MRIQPNLAQNVQPEIKAIGEALETLNAIERVREMTFGDAEPQPRQEPVFNNVQECLAFLRARATQMDGTKDLVKAIDQCTEGRFR